MSLEGKHIVVGISGSIAAYKIATLVRLLIKAKAEVRVIMTPIATDFISPLTLSTLSKHEVYTDISDGESWSDHVALGLWADHFLVAPATANTLAKMAHGIADNMLIATYLSAKCPVSIAPAMDLDMWKHGSTKHNLDRLRSYGNAIINVGTGELASGLVGAGRMAEPKEIIAHLSTAFADNQDLLGKRVMITAGPTYEAIDPVRFIGNRSSGKMGVALAREAARRGAQVDLILGPSKLHVDEANITVHRVTGAQEMHDTCHQHFKKMDVAIMAAAVADYTPVTVSDQKIKKKEGDLSIQLKRTPDIAASLGKIKEDRILVGFALETQNGFQNAQSKLERKNFDFIVLNSLQDAGAGFQHDTNKITIFTREGDHKKYELKSKDAVACDILDQVTECLKK